MKKFICLILAVAFVAVLLLPYAAAEPVVTTAAEPTIKVDLTGLIVSVVVLVFEALLVWIIKAVIPPLRNWLEARTTNEQRTLLYNVVKELVEAAENTIVGVGMGRQKLTYVVDGLEARGFTVDIDMIESVVKRMNDEWALRIVQAMTSGEGEADILTEEDTPESDVEEKDPDI